MTLTGSPALVDFDRPPQNPLLLLQEWLKAAESLHVNEPKGMVLATVDAKGRPSSRVLLLKDCDETGLVFTTSGTSAKGQDLEATGVAAGTLWWRETVQQVNFSGTVQQLSREQSEQLFEERTREARGVAALSKQSAPLADEQQLKEAVRKLVEANSPIACPEHWQAYHLTVDTIEFWVGSPDRFHRRLQYRLVEGSWQHQKLQP